MPLSLKKQKSVEDSIPDEKVKKKLGLKRQKSEGSSDDKATKKFGVIKQKSQDITVPDEKAKEKLGMVKQKTEGISLPGDKAREKLEGVKEKSDGVSFSGDNATENFGGIREKSKGSVSDEPVTNTFGAIKQKSVDISSSGDKAKDRLEFIKQKSGDTFLSHDEADEASAENTSASNQAKEKLKQKSSLIIGSGDKAKEKLGAMKQKSGDTFLPQDDADEASGEDTAPSNKAKQRLGAITQKSSLITDSGGKAKEKFGAMKQKSEDTFLPQDEADEASGEDTAPSNKAKQRLGAITQKSSLITDSGGKAKEKLGAMKQKSEDTFLPQDEADEASGEDTAPGNKAKKKLGSITQKSSLITNSGGKAKEKLGAMKQRTGDTFLLNNEADEASAENTNPSDQAKGKLEAITQKSSLITDSGGKAKEKFGVLKQKSGGTFLPNNGADEASDENTSPSDQAKGRLGSIRQKSSLITGSGEKAKEKLGAMKQKSEDTFLPGDEADGTSGEDAAPSSKAKQKLGAIGQTSSLITGSGEKAKEKLGAMKQKSEDTFLPGDEADGTSGEDAAPTNKAKQKLGAIGQKSSLITGSGEKAKEKLGAMKQKSENITDQDNKIGDKFGMMKQKSEESSNRYGETMKETIGVKRNSEDGTASGDQVGRFEKLKQKPDLAIPGEKAKDTLGILKQKSGDIPGQGERFKEGLSDIKQRSGDSVSGVPSDKVSEKLGVLNQKSEGSSIPDSGMKDEFGVMKQKSQELSAPDDMVEEKLEFMRPPSMATDIKGKGQFGAIRDKSEGIIPQHSNISEKLGDIKQKSEESATSGGKVKNRFGTLRKKSKKGAIPDEKVGDKLDEITPDPEGSTPVEEKVKKISFIKNPKKYMEQRRLSAKAKKLRKSASKSSSEEINNGFDDSSIRGSGGQSTSSPDGIQNGVHFDVDYANDEVFIEMDSQNGTRPDGEEEEEVKKKATSGENSHENSDEKTPEPSAVETGVSAGDAKDGSMDTVEEIQGLVDRIVAIDDGTKITTEATGQENQVPDREINNITDENMTEAASEVTDSTEQGSVGESGNGNMHVRNLSVSERKAEKKEAPNRIGFLVLGICIVIAVVILVIRERGSRGQCAYDSLYRKVTCKGKQLRSIPTDITEGAITLHMGTKLDKAENFFTLLHADNFTRLPNLQELRLIKCGIEDIHSGAFGELSELRRLDLRYNRIRVISEDTFRGLRALEYIYLSNNPIESLPDFVFRNLAVENLLLANNPALTQIEKRAFEGSRIRSIVMNRCSLSTFDADLFDPIENSLEELYITHNMQILDLPPKCFQGLRLQKLTLSHNNLEDVDFLGGLNAKEINLDENPLVEFDCDDCEDLRFTERLTMTKCKLAKLSKENFSSMTALRELDLDGNDLEVFNASVFAIMSQLRILDLSNNDIEGLDGNFTGILPELDSLSLDGNNIETLPASLEPLFSELDNLTLHDNPLHCNCELRWFAKWLEHAEHRRILQNIDAVTCETPEQQNFTYVSDYGFQCRAPTILNATFDTDGITLLCTAEGDPPPTVSWLGPGGDLKMTEPSAWDRDRFQTRSSVTISRDGNYTCEARNLVGVDVITINTREMPTSGLKFHVESQEIEILETQNGFMIVSALLVLLGYMLKYT